MQRRLRIGIDAMIADGSQGGVQQFIIGLAQGLSALTDGNETYIFLVYYDHQEWLAPYIGGNCQILAVKPAPMIPGWKRSLRRFVGLRSMWHRLRSVSHNIRVPVSDGMIEQMDLDLLHFTTQRGFLTQIPTIYHPWDLQHIHLPQFFTPLERAHRDTLYRTFCHQARMVAVASTWTKQDIITHYQVDARKINVVPMASVVSGYPKPTATDIEHVKTKYRLPERFAFYPANPWKHKNHIHLLRAIAQLRDQFDILVPLVFTGGCDPHAKTIDRVIEDLSLTELVYKLGYVPTSDVAAIYHLCTMMVFPSRFEGWGLPLSEAMEAGVPIACSNVNHLPALVADAALLFDPDDVDSIAQSIRSIWTDQILRQELGKNGKRRSAEFSWERTARLFRAHYRRITQRELTEEDRSLLLQEALV
jgi:glycosyltransferase involved in cell wall biosynthesis